MKRFSEAFHNNATQTFEVEEIIYEGTTGFQEILIFRNATFGRVMALDGVIQTTEADEFVYHEMLAHVPLFAHGAAKQILNNSALVDVASGLEEEAAATRQLLGSPNQLEAIAAQFEGRAPDFQEA